MKREEDVARKVAAIMVAAKSLCADPSEASVVCAVASGILAKGLGIGAAKIEESVRLGHAMGPHDLDDYIESCRAKGLPS